MLTVGETAPNPTAWGITADQHALLLDPDHHAEALSRIAAGALLAGDWDTAHAFADRLCRLSAQARARGFLFRAEAARRLGDLSSARSDLQQALACDPTDGLVNLCALGLADGEMRRGAAHAIVDDPGSPPEAFRTALKVLHDESGQVVGGIEAHEAELRGWLSWPRGVTLHCAIAGEAGRETWTLSPDPAHPFGSDRWHAAGFVHPRADPGPIELHVFGESPSLVPYRVRFPAREQAAAMPLADEPADLTVIVPVFEDEEATRVCLDSLEAQDLPGVSWRIVVVDDASPNAALVEEVRRRAQENRLTLLTNATNLGFAASVNRAASLTSQGDLLLLNADTILPQGALARLRTLAALPGVGTLTPVSNNGIVTSFPVPYDVNDLPPAADLMAWDRAAAAADPPPVEIPNGIGFCLFVTRPCWAAVGGMPLAYGQGYYEDVDFCLVARHHGFRNLCATNLIVGHAGSRSFGARKRGLVVRNGAVLAQRHPEYRDEIEAFRVAEPLRPAFAAIERGIAPPPYDLLILDPLPVRSPALVRWCAQWQEAGLRCLHLERDGSAPDLRVRLRGSPGLPPQSLSFSLDAPGDRHALGEYLRATQLGRLVIGASERCPRILTAFALDLGLPLDLLVPGAAIFGLPVDCERSGEPGPDGESGLWETNGPRELANLLEHAETLLCSDGMSAALMERERPEFRRKLVRLAAGEARSAKAVDPAPRVPRLGILCPVPTAETSRLAMAIETGARRLGVALQLVVIGSPLNDLTLMAGSVFVTGSVPAAETAAVVARYRCAALLLPYRDGLFDCLEDAAGDVGPRRAYFDWSGGAYRPRPGDLALAPAMACADAAARIVQWFASDPESRP